MGVSSSKVSADTKNAKVVINYLIGRDISINTKNAMIEMKNLKVEKLGAYTINGKILLENLQNYDNAADIELVLKTKNADIKANINDTGDRGYMVKARTSNGGINLLIPSVLYRNIPKTDSSNRQIEAETENYSNAAQKVHINAETQNGYIEVIK